MQGMMMSKSTIKISDDWAKHPVVEEILSEYTLKKSQRDLLTPVLISSANIDAIRRSFVEFYRKTGLLTSPLSFRYSYSVSLKNKRGVTIIPKVYLERDLTRLLQDYKIVTNTDMIVPTGADWEIQTYEFMSYFELPCKAASHKLVKTRVGGVYVGYEFKEVFKDKEI
jgi:hypothetical protein